jgi:hypothetical protein
MTTLRKRLFARWQDRHDSSAERSVQYKFEAFFHGVTFTTASPTLLPADTEQADVVIRGILQVTRTVAHQQGHLFKVRADYLNHVLRGLFGGFRILRHVVEDVVFHEFRHQAVDRTTGGSETAENLGALLVAIESLEYRLELPNDFFGSIYQIQFFSRSMRHFA